MTGVGVPRWVYVPAITGALFVAVPLVAIVLQLDWSQLPGLLTSEFSLTALWLSIRTTTVATLFCVVLGIPMAVVLARMSFRGQDLARSVVLLPLVIPPVVAGLALLYTFGRQGLLGSRLSVLGVDIAFTTAAVILAQTFVALPFLVISLDGALRSAGARYEGVAATLGAGPSRVMFRVTLPMMLPALASGTVLAFARALGEFGATLTFAGSLAGTTRTLPLEIYLQREVDPQAAVALSVLLIIVAVLVVGLTRRSVRTA